MIDIYQRNFDYLIASAPGECPFDMSAADRMHIVMSPCGLWLLMADADAFLIVMDDAQGLAAIGHADLFEFTGNRPNFDDWMAAQHPDISYGWVDQFAMGFADQAARLSFNDDFGERVLRAAPFPRQAASPPSAPTRQ
jgi:hypothetical protein